MRKNKLGISIPPLLILRWKMYLPVLISETKSFPKPSIIAAVSPLGLKSKLVMELPRGIYDKSTRKVREILSSTIFWIILGVPLHLFQ